MAKPEATQRIYVRLQFLQAPFPQGPEYAAPLRVDGESVVGRSMFLVFDGTPDANGFVNATASVVGPDRPSSLYKKYKGFRLQANETDVIARGTVLKMVVPQQGLQNGTRVDALPQGDLIVDGLPDRPVFKQKHAPTLSKGLRGSTEPAPSELPVKSGWHAPVRYHKN